MKRKKEEARRVRREKGRNEGTKERRKEGRMEGRQKERKQGRSKTSKDTQGEARIYKQRGKDEKDKEGRCVSAERYIILDHCAGSSSGFLSEGTLNFLGCNSQRNAPPRGVGLRRLTVSTCLRQEEHPSFT